MDEGFGLVWGFEGNANVRPSAEGWSADAS
jgi:hypothetical protein